jgi:hypothetical protein
MKLQKTYRQTTEDKKKADTGDKAGEGRQRKQTIIRDRVGRRQTAFGLDRK